MPLKNFPDDTIAAISTPLGEGGLGVMRLSGREAVQIADSIFKAKSGRRVKDQKSFTAQYGRVFSGRAVLDEALLLVMRAPKSYTCEDVVEISVHGGAAVLQAVLALVMEKGARLAERGEFTKRAFLNGRIDLLQAEAVLDLVQAKTDLTREWASDKLEGALSAKIRTSKNQLVDILTHLEASIDFPEDFPDTASLLKLAGRLEGIAGEFQKILEGAEYAIVLKRGLRLVLAGRPNVGKSSLMNELSRANRVIVTPYPGTTRDVVEEEIQLRGLPLRLSDTAGIQFTDHPIEKEGIERSRRALHEADLVLYVLDGSQSWHEEDRRLLTSLEAKKKILAVNKSDLPARLEIQKLQKEFPEALYVSCSCVRKDGLKKLEEAIYSFVVQGKAEPSETPLVNTVRQKEFLSRALQSVREAAQGCREDRSPELIAVELRLALDSLGALTGEVVTDDILEALFNQFCIGK